MKKTNFTIHSLTRVAHWCMSLLLLFVLSSQASAQTDNCNLVCNDHVNVSMPATANVCQRIVEPADVLNNLTDGCIYTVVLSHPFGTNDPGDNQVDRTHIGYTFIYSVKNELGNSCWGYVTIEDKAAPLGGCKSRTMTCFQLSTIQAALGEVVDNCALASPPAKIEKLTVNVLGDGCTDPTYIARVFRTIRTWDPWGNTSTCNDTLYIKRDSLNKVKCPDLVPLDCALTGLPSSSQKRKDIDKYAKQYNTSVSWTGDKLIFSKTPGSVNYPTPNLLLALHAANCIPEDTLVVPAIQDSVLVIIDGECIKVDSCVPMWPALGGVCKTTIGYSDELLEICPGGAGFKIRRQWRIANWCTGRDTVCVQYIKVEDKLGPVITKSPTIGNYYANAHDCYSDVNIGGYELWDCSPVEQNFIMTYQDPGHPGKNIVVHGTLPTTKALKIPAGPYGECAQIDVRLVDKCYNVTTDHFEICVEDKTPPTPVCDEFTRVTVDPATCWARVYAHDLDNGSRDNCCNLLHFAVAHMDSITATRSAWTSYWDKNCKADYWKYKAEWDGWLEEYINCFVFRDYIDLTECGTNRVVLRVYEACGVPRYDSHVFPCSEHDWFTYNTFTLCRRWHNYQKYLAKKNDAPFNCSARPGAICKPTNWQIKDYTWNLESEYDGGSVGLDGLKQLCNFSTPLNSSEPIAPGNRCSGRLYNDCMINIQVDDKTLPVCTTPDDVYWYCDNAGGINNVDKQLEYAHRWCEEGDGDYTCEFKDNEPYNIIECVKENDGSYPANDTIDPAGKNYGYYSCAVYGDHVDEHGTNKNRCDENDYSHLPSWEGNQSDAAIAESFNRYSSWVPVYCRSWLCADSYDAAGKVDAKSAFWSPELRSLGQNGPIQRPAATGKNSFKVWDNCWIDTAYTYKDEQFVDQCGNGWYQRTWTFKDKCVGTISCSQKIYTYHRSDFEVMFPQDVTLNCDAPGSTSPDAAGRPMVMDDECELVGVNYEDVRYDVVADACYKIVRTWKLIDWCKYDPNDHRRKPEVIVDDRFVASSARACVFTKLKDNGDGYMTYTQIIKVIDTKAPDAVACKDTTICINTGYGGYGTEPEVMCTVPSYTTDPFAATDNCTPANQIEFRWEIDFENNGSVDYKSPAKQTRFSSTQLPSGLSVGTHKLYVIAEDNCSNEDTSYCLITVKDCKKPTPYCYNGIATVVMPSTKSVIVWAKDLDAGSYDNCTKRIDLGFTFGSNGQASDTFTCDDIANGVEQSVTVDIWVTDKTGNKDYCRTYLLIQDGSGDACPNKSAVAGSIAGKVATEATEPVENVLLEVKSASTGIPAFKTDAKGLYAFNNLNMKIDYSIAPKRDDDPTNGVSTIDLVLIQKHILGTQPLNSAYKVIAADVDRSNDISAVDLVELRKLILTVYDKLPNNTSWRFVPKSYTFSNVSTPWGFPEKIDISSLSQAEINRDFVGVKVGDVNATAVPHSLLGAEARTGGQSLKFRTLDRELKAGEEATIEFTADNFNSIEGYQFTLAMRGLDLKSVQSGVLKVSENNFGVTKLGQGFLTTSWNESKGITAGSNDVLFSITVKATKATSLSESLVINSKYTRAEAYNNTEALGVALEVGKKSVAGYALHQNTPNPFKSTTMINYELAKASAVTLKITDVTGKVVRVYNRDGQKGFNQISINRSDIAGAGVLYYTLETKDFSSTKKMIVVE